jgi:hypothetical protein
LKHLRAIGGAQISDSCFCGKVFKERTALWRHKKMCEDAKSSNVKLTSAIMTLIHQNQDLQKQLLEIAKDSRQIIHNSVTNHNTNHFNLQVFLNETCKEALNMMDFVKLMKIELFDMEEIGRIGYSDGVSRIFVNGLKELDAHKRPIHCSDFKREVIYIKEDNVWEKDNEEKTRIKQAIRCVEHKNIVQIPVWIKAHPNCVVSSNKENAKYLQMICESTGGQDYSQVENNIDKIIRNIMREVVINKKRESE